MLQLARWMRRGLQLATPLKWFGVDLSEFEKAAAEVLGLEPQIQDMLTADDRFNTAFSTCCWAAFGSMNDDIKKQATQLAESGDLEDAEQLLVSQYDRETLEFLTRRASILKAMEPRTRLIRLAIEDHLAGRYHASIPVVL